MSAQVTKREAEQLSSSRARVWVRRLDRTIAPRLSAATGRISRSRLAPYDPAVPGTVCAAPDAPSSSGS